MMLEITMWIFIISNIYMMLRTWQKDQKLSQFVKNWKKNPTKMDLALATTKQIVNELLGRAQPIIMIMPELPKIENQPVETIQLYVLNIHPQQASVLLHNAGERLQDQDSEPTDN